MSDFRLSTKQNNDYKRFVGDRLKYYEIGKILFDLLLKYGMQPKHKLLDIGCGSLRLGIYAIPYLDRENYHGIEPETWLLREALKYEFKMELINEKRPLFSYNSDFSVTGNDYDYIIANSVYIHATIEQIEKSISEASKALFEYGVFLFNFMAGEKDNKMKEWSYPSHVYYKKSTIESILKSCKLQYKYIDVAYPGQQTWLEVRK